MKKVSWQDYNKALTSGEVGDWEINLEKEMKKFRETRKDLLSQIDKVSYNLLDYLADAVKAGKEAHSDDPDFNHDDALAAAGISLEDLHFIYDDEANLEVVLKKIKAIREKADKYVKGLGK